MEDEDSQDAAMREMMGFSSFGNQKRNDQNTTEPTLTPIPELPEKISPSTTMNSIAQSKSTVEQTLQSSNFAMLPASLPPVPAQSKSRSSPAPSNISTSTNQAASNIINPDTGVPFTRAELEELARGKVNANGDTVYFKPGFIVDDPWARIKDLHESRKRRAA